jgi:hypothetical protein
MSQKTPIFSQFFWRKYFKNHNIGHRFLTTESLEALNKHSESLLDLYIGDTVRFLPEYVCTRMDEDQVRSLDPIPQLQNV